MVVGRLLWSRLFIEIPSKKYVCGIASCFLGNSNEYWISHPKRVHTYRILNVEDRVIKKLALKEKQVAENSDNKSHLERNFVTPIRAMTEFLLKPSDLETLRKTRRRSPFENEPPLTVYWLKDVEAKALEVWGSWEAFEKEKRKSEEDNKRYQQYIFSVKRVLRDLRKEQQNQQRQQQTPSTQDNKTLWDHSGRVVLTAIAINACNFVFKLVAWVHTGSHSMFAEALHSLADTVNQLILAFGIHKSAQQANIDHPYGYGHMRYVASLISGVGIFCVGAGLSFYHGVTGLYNPEPLQPFYWAFFIMGGSIVSEGATLVIAIQSLKKGAAAQGTTFWDYVWRGHDPSVNVVFMEDLAAVAGVCVATTCMALSTHWQSHIPDAVGSLLVGGILGVVASFIIYTNTAALVGRSIAQERLAKINLQLENDLMIRAVHDVKGIDMGSGLVRYKAELDFDGRELTRSYLQKQDLELMLEEVRNLKTIDELEAFMLKHGENIVDVLGAEIDRIELELKKNHPEIRHCDLELL